MAFPYNNQLDAFELYHRIQERDGKLHGESSAGLPALGHALAGSAGTAISHILLYPLDLVVTRLQVQKQLRGPSEAPSAAAEADIEYKNIVDAAKKIYAREGGLKAFYAGCLTDTSKSIVDAFLFFLVYTFLRTRRLQSLGTRSLPVRDELAVGVAAGALSKFVTTPISQIVTRKQTAAMVAARDPTSSLPADQTNKLSIKDIALQIRSERGITGFWAGYRASLILTLNPALTFLFHNLLSRSLLPASQREKPGPKLTFLIAALSKAAASSTMYPFSLAKTRAQLTASHKSPVVANDDEKSPFKHENLQSNEAQRSNPSRSARPRGIVQNVNYAIAFVLAQAKKPSPLMTSLVQVYKTDGVLALYAGLQGEVLKGFLGHGLTMLLKERIHLAIVSAYFLMLKTAQRSREGSTGWRDDAMTEMSRYASYIGESVDSAKQTVGSGLGGVSSGFEEVKSRGTEVLENISGRSGELLDGAKGTGAQIWETVTTKSGETLQGLRGSSDEALASVRDTSGEILQGATQRSTEIVETVKEGAGKVVAKVGGD